MYLYLKLKIPLTIKEDKTYKHLYHIIILFPPLWYLTLEDSNVINF